MTLAIKVMSGYPYSVDLCRRGLCPSSLCNAFRSGPWACAILPGSSLACLLSLCVCGREKNEYVEARLRVIGLDSCVSDRYQCIEHQNPFSLWVQTPAPLRTEAVHKSCDVA